MSCSEQQQAGGSAALATLAIYEGIEATGLDAVIAAACPATWQQAIICLSSPEPSDHLLGLRLVLEALNTTPDGPQTLITRLGQRLAGRG